jgi:hypothetical protein
MMTERLTSLTYNKTPSLPQHSIIHPRQSNGVGISHLRLPLRWLLRLISSGTKRRVARRISLELSEERTATAYMVKQVVRSSETSEDFCGTARRYIPEYCTLQHVENVIPWYHWYRQNILILVPTCQHTFHMYCHVFMAPWLIITGSGFDDWIYWHFLVQSLLITINYKNSQSIFLVCRGLVPFSFSFYDWPFTWNSALYSLGADPSENTVSQQFVWVFTAPLPRNGWLLLSRIVVRISQHRAVYKNLSPRERVYQAVT